jgi:hypothetical protein
MIAKPGKIESAPTEPARQAGAPVGDMLYNTFCAEVRVRYDEITAPSEPSETPKWPQTAFCTIPGNRDVLNLQGRLRLVQNRLAAVKGKPLLDRVNSVFEMLNDIRESPHRADIYFPETLSMMDVLDPEAFRTALAVIGRNGFTPASERTPKLHEFNQAVSIMRAALKVNFNATALADLALIDVAVSAWQTGQEAAHRIKDSETTEEFAKLCAIQAAADQRFHLVLQTLRGRTKPALELQVTAAPEAPSAAGRSPRRVRKPLSGKTRTITGAQGAEPVPSIDLGKNGEA